MLKAVIFDVDGVLVDSVPASLSGINRALSRYDLSLADLDGDHRASSIKHILELIHVKHGTHIEFDPFIAEVGQHIFEQLEGTQIDAGLADFLDHLERRNIARAIGSSSTRGAVDRKLVLLGVADKFDVIVSAEEVEKHKPAPDIYLKALERLGIKGSEAVVIEDAVAGVEAARAAGIQTIGFAKYNEDPAASIGADVHVQNWQDITYDSLAELAS